MKLKIISISGAKDSGKSTLAEIIKKDKKDRIIWNSSKTLKEAFCVIFGHKVEDLDRHSYKVQQFENNISIRQALIEFGECIEKRFNGTFETNGLNLFQWSSFKSLEKEIKDLEKHKTETIIIIPDLRSKEAYLYLKEEMAKLSYDYSYHPIYLYEPESEFRKGKHWTETFLEKERDLIEKEFTWYENNKKMGMDCLEFIAKDIEKKL